MKLHTTGVLDLLRQKPGRYVEYLRGDYTMREDGGAAVTVIEGGEEFAIHPAESQIDDLVRASHLVRDGSKYRPQG
jgi:hypothetical protein